MNQTDKIPSKDDDQVNISFSKEEAKIIFDALSAHKFKISQKKSDLSNNLSLAEMEAFLNQRFNAIDNEIATADKIFDKIGHVMKAREEN